MASVAWVSLTTEISFLWYNVVGAVAVLVVGAVVSALTGGDSRADRMAVEAGGTGGP
jgi:hypothetical protein